MSTTSIPPSKLQPDYADLLMAAQLITQSVEQYLRGTQISPYAYHAALSTLERNKQFFPAGPS